MTLDHLKIIAKAAADDQACDYEQFTAFVATIGPQVVLRLVVLLEECAKLIQGCEHGFISYACGNQATDLANECAHRCREMFVKLGRDL